MNHFLAMWSALTPSVQGVAILFLVLQVLDILSTRLALNMGFSEINPVARACIRWFGVVPGLVVLKTVVLALPMWAYISRPIDQLPMPMLATCLYVMSLIYLLVVCNNLRLLRIGQAQMAPPLRSVLALMHMLILGHEVKS